MVLLSFQTLNNSEFNFRFVEANNFFIILTLFCCFTYNSILVLYTSTVSINLTSKQKKRLHNENSLLHFDLFL